jgi:hypothetical protein
MSAGLPLLPVSIVIGAMSRLMGRIAERVGPRWPLTLGPIVAATGFALMTHLDPRDGYWLGVAPGLVLIALGMAGPLRH